MVAQVQPPLLEKEITTLFINSLESIYYEKLVGSTTRDFADLVTTGEAIERALKSGKLNSLEASKKSYVKKKENEVNVAGNDGHPYPKYQSPP